MEIPLYTYCLLSVSMQKINDRYLITKDRIGVTIYDI